MYSPEMIAAFGEFKSIWIPRDRMNPGVAVLGRGRLDADVRVHAAGPRPAARTQLAFAHDGGSLEAATRRCVGVGACLSASGDVMCPSYRATGEEQHSTRGRARLLFEFASGRRAWTRRTPTTWPCPRPLPVLQGLQTRLSRRCGHGRVQG